MLSGNVRWWLEALCVELEVRPSKFKHWLFFCLRTSSCDFQVNFNRISGTAHLSDLFDAIFQVFTKNGV